MKKEVLGMAISSIEFFLDPTISTDKPLRRQISNRLMAGDIIVIRNAFQSAFADRMFDCLNNYSNWKLYEGYEKHFHYHHHNIYDETLFPDALRHCRDVFASEPTKSLVQDLSRRDCTGPVTFSASLYRPGDHSLPHNDFTVKDGLQRQVAFVWNLTRDWRPDWGGEFFWCKKSRGVNPSFNTLLLFNVDRSCKHFVTLVSPHAQGKRLAISGWWMGKAESTNPETSASGPAEEPRVEMI